MTSDLKAVCVFCGSSEGTDSTYAEAAISVGKTLAENGIQLVYGGGTSGLMGTVAAAQLSSSGRVHGIIPQALTDKERKFIDPKAIAIPKELKSPTIANEAKEDDKSIVTVVHSMHERKMKMAALSSAFIGLPGGFGTLEEIAEMTTWTQLGIHKKPVILLNVNGFYEGLRMFINTAIESGFIAEMNRSFMVFVDEPQDKDWGKAALKGIEDWFASKMGGGKAYDLKWTEAQKKDISS